MSDPVGLINNGGPVQPLRPSGPGFGPGPGGGVGGPSFRDALLENLNRVNAAQQEADAAVEDLVSGRRSDVEGVILATQKADNAFKMLQAVRGKVLAAYDELKQVRV